MAALGANPFYSRHTNQFRNFHNLTTFSSDLVYAGRKDDPNIARLETKMHAWLVERECEYTMDRNDANRAAATFGFGYMPSRFADDQKIFWSLITHLFDGHPRFQRAITTKNILQQYYATEVWKKIYLQINPRDPQSSADIVKEMTAALTIFHGDFEAWSNEVHRLFYEMQLNGQAYNEIVLCEQMQTSIRDYITANADYPEAKTSKWEIFLCTELDAQLQKLGGGPVTIDSFVDIGVAYERKIGGPGLPKPRAAPTTPAAKGAHPNMAYQLGFAAGQKDPNGQVPVTPSNLFNHDHPRKPCTTLRSDGTPCGLTNHESEDCFHLPANANMWCGRCKSRSHWEVKCRFLINDERRFEKGGRGRGRGKNFGKGSGGKGGGRGQPEKKKTLDCHICLENHVAGQCKFKDAVNAFSQIFIKQNREPTQAELSDLVSKMRQNTMTSDQQHALVAQDIGRQIRSEIYGNGALHGRYADASASADIAMRAELESLRQRVAQQEQAYSSMNYGYTAYPYVMAEQAQQQPPPPPMPQLILQPAPIAQQSVTAPPRLPALPAPPQPLLRNGTNLSNPHVALSGMVPTPRAHVQLGPQTMGRGAGPPAMGHVGISFPPRTKIIPKRVFEDADEDDDDVGQGVQAQPKIPKLFSMLWPKMFLLRVVGYVCRLFFRQDDIVTDAREHVSRGMHNPRTEHDLRRMAMVMCEIASLQGGPPDLAMSAVLRMQDDGNLWMVVDSGANRHYVCSEKFLCHIRPAVSMVYGVGDANVQTTSRGLLQGQMRTESGNHVSVSTMASHVPAASISLFSVPMACQQGHSVQFVSPRENLAPGQRGSGMKLAGSDEWIPFTWDERTGLWWVCFRPDPTAAYGTRVADDAYD
mmetsp:Transcript_18530/g.37665  ORF Transcript_18530/g.37665 Transcript_18530/m.37665 type:complete len:869 (+) Transcript_18530:750-3356(+)